VTVSGVLQLLWLMWACHRAGVSLKLTLPRLTPDVKLMLALIAPAAIGQGAIQFNLLISTSLAARFLPEGSVSWLYYADRLNQLPLGLIGIAIGTAILPALSRQIAGADSKAASDTQNRAVELALFFAMPAMVALIVSAIPIVHGIFEHGAFTSADTQGTAAVLMAFSAGVPAYVLIKVLTPGFYARSDTKTPLRLALWSMAVNLIGNLILIWPLAHIGVGVATAIAAWVNVALLWFTLRKRGHIAVDVRLKQKAWRIALAAGVMGVSLFFGNEVIEDQLGTGLLRRIAVLSILVSAGGVVYALAIFLFGAYRLHELKSLFRRRAATPAANLSE
jgi:putative peptidoglycan lipid II flippase